MTSNCNICIQQGLKPSDIIMRAPELHDSGVDNTMKKMVGRGLPEVEEHLHRSREHSDILTLVDRNSRQAARLDQNKGQEAGCRGKKEKSKI
jgi:2-methylcitrate dehydratase PrpD